MFSIAIIDVLGLPYDGDTLSKRGLGGSESSVILISQELVKLGFSVTVFNNCVDTDVRPGNYNGVWYYHFDDIITGTPNYDIIISSRSVRPFIEPKFHNLIKEAKYKVLWMHDTFVQGSDPIVEKLLVDKAFDEVFTLSDFHSIYVTNCDHGNRRNFEVLKPHVWQTRDGIRRYHDYVDIAAKYPHMFVYNASVTKGMVPLVKDIWPRVQEQIPQAMLTIIGGFYRFPDRQPDEQEKTWHELKALPNDGISFTGIISQQDIANILTKASFFLAPGAFPETFGISILEALNYNTPVIACRFGAAEETAIDKASYLIDYPVEPNSLFPNINKPEQINKYVDMVVRAHKDRYLWQQKANYCNIVKDISQWDSVALQWKQHFYKVLGEYLPVEEYRKVKQINHKVARVFNRRFSNRENLVVPNIAKKEQRIVVISPFYNAEKYIERCIKSVAAQDYNNYEHILIDDASTDESFYIACKTKGDLERVSGKALGIQILQNKENKGAVRNQIETIRDGAPNDIIMFLDGDDCLVNNADIFSFYNNLFSDDTEFAYGSCWSMVDNIPLIAQEYPPAVKQNRSYRKHKFAWNIPYPHLRVFRKRLIDDVPDSAFQDADGKWYRAGGDVAVFYEFLEQADPYNVRVVQDIVYNYNDTNPINDYKVNSNTQTKTAKEILAQPGPSWLTQIIDDIHKKVENSMSIPAKEWKDIEKSMEKKLEPTHNYLTGQPYLVKPYAKKILIAIPTAKYIESETFKSIYDLDIPEGYTADFQYFYGYQTDQVRNLIADWVVRDYDYLFAVDSDIAFGRDTLAKLLSHNKDMVSGLYVQRLPDKQLEIYEDNGQRMHYSKVHNRFLVKIGGCGFGCVLVKKEVLAAVGYPQFKYHSALDHKNTVSEDTDFCTKAKAKGFTIWADGTIRCRHLGSTEYLVPDVWQAPPTTGYPTTLQEKLRELSKKQLIHKDHYQYLLDMRNNEGWKPNIIYDIGACVLHWTIMAKFVWPDAKYYAFDAFDKAEFLYKEHNIPYYIGVLSDKDGKVVDYWQNDDNPGGNGYFKTNKKFVPDIDKLQNESHKQTRKTITLDTVIRQRGFPMPDLVKMDVQGAELDILKGASFVLSHTKDLILELQNEEFNKGAPLADEVIKYLDGIGFKLVKAFSKNVLLDKQVDGDYHFRKSK